ncbi:hypothetical protein SAMN04488132_10453 [Sediminibacterium ginsengisoli]|uniref:Uncharacterized protein n=1 Tax=Sediminibacterium ginsengisoli TaxID=413434 RepID=A0A1T4N217_9BACT|nr:hypothetical protein SAMN04488132_10453 [Sediminibacterium ginsengisoli]
MGELYLSTDLIRLKAFAVLNLKVFQGLRDVNQMWIAVDNQCITLKMLIFSLKSSFL